MVSVTIQGPPDPSDSTQYICHCAAETTETQTAMSGASNFTLYCISEVAVCLGEGRGHLLVDFTVFYLLKQDSCQAYLY